jgi:hypothetical protein
MHRPRFIGCIQVALAAWMALAVCGCGKGLFTTRHFVETPRDATMEGGSIDAAIVVTPPDGSTPVDVQPNTDAQPPVDMRPPVDVQPPVDVPPASDALVPGATTTESVDDIGKDVVLGPATLEIRNAFRQTTSVTLTLESFGGSQLIYSGAIGPVFSIAKGAPLGVPAILRIRFVPPASIPQGRVALAYQDPMTSAHLWIHIAGSSYNPATGEVSGSVVDFSGTRIFAPIEFCSDAQPTCPAGLGCQGGACQ